MLNSAPVRRSATTIFIALPAELWRPITGGCQCHYCRGNPDKVPCWDTLAVGAVEGDWTWTVHFPEFSSK